MCAGVVYTFPVVLFSSYYNTTKIVKYIRSAHGACRQGYVTSSGYVTYACYTFENSILTCMPCICITILRVYTFPSRLLPSDAVAYVNKKKCRYLVRLLSLLDVNTHIIRPRIQIYTFPVTRECIIFKYKQLTFYVWNIIIYYYTIQCIRKNGCK